MTASNENDNMKPTEAAKPAEKPKKPKKAAAPKEAEPKAAPAKPRKAPGTIDIGVDVKIPEGTCTDRDCPFHGTLSVRGVILEGEVVSDKMQLTAVVKKKYMRKDRKYERLEKRSSKYLAHNPPCMAATVGDHVKIMECRPLSKKVSFVIIEKSKKE